MCTESVLPLRIPSWVNWVAQDSSGLWWGYSVEPLRHDSGWYENEVGRCVQLGRTAADAWADSLQATGSSQLATPCDDSAPQSGA